MIMNLPNGDSRNFWIKCFQMFVMLVFGSCAYAQDAPSGPTPTASFSMLGYLQELTVDQVDNPLSSGSMVINGVKIILPGNLLIKMPGQYLTVNDLFRGSHPDLNTKIPLYPSSGLALNDNPRPAIPFEVEVIGNIVNGRYIAGWVSLSQQNLNLGAGYIRCIDYKKGELLVGIKPNNIKEAESRDCNIADPDIIEARVRINYPECRYGFKNSEKVGGAAFDERFSADPGNASVISETGFPMCIPRENPNIKDDEFCPRSNRAPDRMRFTCGKTSNDPTALPYPDCNPKKLSPLKVGDYITYAGMLTEDVPGNGKFFHAAHSIKAMTGIYTSPGIDPAYVYIEEAILGTLGEPFKDISQEETSRFRIVGFTTDPSRRVEVFLLDWLGSKQNERRLTILDPQRVGQIGRVRITLPAKSNFLPVTRDVRIRIEGIDADTKLDNGMDSGQYTAPVGEYIYPENTRFGDPAFPVSVPFENFCFLSKGGGQLDSLGRGESGPKIERLDPFPDSGHKESQKRANGLLVCP